MKRALVRSALGSAALQAFSRLAMLAASVLLARMLGAAEYGVYATVLAAALILVVAAGMGLPTVAVRMLPSYLVRGRPDLLQGFLRSANRSVVLAALLLGAIGSYIAWRIDPAHAAAWWWGMALVPLLALGNLRSAALRGLHRVVLGQLPECLVIPAAFLVLLLTVSGPTGESAVIIRWVATLIAFVVGSVLLLRRLPAEARAAAPRSDARTWTRAATPSLFTGAMAVVLSQADVLMVAALKGAEAAGIYQAGARGAELVAFSMIVVNFAVQPVISSLYTEGQLAKLQRVITAGARTGAALALPVALVLGFFAEPILGTAFGPAFARGAACLAILCAAQAIAAAMGSVEHIMNMTGHERDTAAALAIGALANIALNALFIPAWGIEGAALASAASLLLWRGLLALRVRSRLGLWPAAFHV